MPVLGARIKMSALLVLLAHPIQRYPRFASEWQP